MLTVGVRSMFVRRAFAARPLFGVGGGRRHLSIVSHLYVKQNSGDNLCMVASTATVLNAKYGSPLYALDDMQERFEKTLKVGDSATAGYDNSNLVPVLKGLSVPFKWCSYKKGLVHDSGKLKKVLGFGWIMMSYKSGPMRHSCVLCDVDGYGQFQVYDPAYGAVITYQLDWLLQRDVSLEYFIPKLDLNLSEADQ